MGTEIEKLFSTYERKEGRIEGYTILASEAPSQEPDKQASDNRLSPKEFSVWNTSKNKQRHVPFPIALK